MKLYGHSLLMLEILVSLYAHIPSSNHHVEYVRIIRDRKTNVGKGFGYVQFKERSDVALALKCDGGFIGTRAIRVSRASESLAQVFKKNSTKQDGKEKAVVEGVRASRSDPAKKIRVRSAVSKKKKGKK